MAPQFTCLFSLIVIIVCVRSSNSLEDSAQKDLHDLGDARSLENIIQMKQFMSQYKGNKENRSTTNMAHGEQGTTNLDFYGTKIERTYSPSCDKTILSQNGWSSSSVRQICGQELKGKGYHPRNVKWEMINIDKETSSSSNQAKMYASSGRAMHAISKWRLPQIDNSYLAFSDSEVDDRQSEVHDHLLEQVQDDHGMSPAEFALDADLDHGLDLMNSKDKRRLPCQLEALLPSANEPLPWACTQRQQWISLESNTFPNRLRQTICEGQGCMNGHLDCTPVIYTAQLVKVCSTDEECYDERVPINFRGQWKFLDYNVTVDCACTR